MLNLQGSTAKNFFKPADKYIMIICMYGQPQKRKCLLNELSLNL